MPTVSDASVARGINRYFLSIESCRRFPSASIYSLIPPFFKKLRMKLGKFCEKKPKLAENPNQAINAPKPIPSIGKLGNSKKIAPPVERPQAKDAMNASKIPAYLRNFFFLLGVKKDEIAGPIFSIFCF